MLPPLRLQPLFQQRPWGGHRLADEWHKSDADSAGGWGESWEVADLGPVQSRVIGGPFNGTPLGTLITEHRDEMLGPQAAIGPFSLLFKFLDAAERLSVQVHPNDELAQRLTLGPRGKSEAWVVLTAEPGSLMFVGLRSGIDRETLESHLAAGTVADCLHALPARPGDVFSIPAGTVHAIGAGVTLAELQQSSDATLRLFDWNRRDAQGRPRTLHIDAALRCIDFTAGPVSPAVPRRLPAELFSATAGGSSGENMSEELTRTPYFTWRRHTGSDPFTLKPIGRCRLLSLINGQADLQSGRLVETLRPGDTRFIPAATDRLIIQPRPHCVLLDAEP